MSDKSKCNLASQAGNGLLKAGQQAIAPLDVFNGDWLLNMMLFAVIVLTYGLATAPRQ